MTADLNLENRKLVITRLGETFRDGTQIVSEPVVAPGPTEVIVRNHYAGVNGVYDQMMCLDRIDHTRIIPPAGTGVEAVGEVVAVGSTVEGLVCGDPVATVRVGHGYQLLQRCEATEVIRIPAATPEVLALIPSGVSALLALERVGELRADDRVCISAAAGGLGNILLQLAAQRGNEVIAICGSDAKAQRLLELGAARVIQYRRESVAEVLGRDYKDGIDLALDSVGGAVFDALLENLAPFGRLVVCGFTSDRLPTEKVSQERVYTQLYWKAASIRGFMNYRFAEHAPDARSRLLDMLAEGRLQPLVATPVFHGLEAVADAVEHLLAGRNIGKVLVDLRD